MDLKQFALLVKCGGEILLLEAGQKKGRMFQWIIVATGFVSFLKKT